MFVQNIVLFDYCGYFYISNECLSDFKGLSICEISQIFNYQSHAKSGPIKEYSKGRAMHFQNKHCNFANNL